MAVRRGTLKARVEELETLVDRLKQKRDQSIMNLTRGQDLTNDNVDELKDEQKQTTTNMVEMHDQVTRMIKVAEDLKVETGIVKNIREAAHDVKDQERHMKIVVADYLKERAAKFGSMLFASTVGGLAAVGVIALVYLAIGYQS